MVKSSKKWIWAATCASALLFALPMPGQARVAMEYQQTEITVSGQVRSSQGEAIAGVTVRYGGAESSTDQNGRFSFQMATAGDVVFSAVGYAPHTERVTQDTVLNVVLQAGESTLEEVVVIGYGSVKRKDLTGAVASVKAEEIAMAPVANPIEALQGRVAGVRSEERRVGTVGWGGGRPEDE